MKKALSFVLSLALAVSLAHPVMAAEAEAKVRVGSLKGPTTMGIVNLMSDEAAAEVYEFTMAVQADEILPKMVSGDLDIALVPANAAANLYQKTKGGVSVIDLNTLGVLYCVTGDETVASVKDLAGKTVMMTGQGTTPEYVIRYLLAQNEVTDCELEFKSEPTEVAAVLAEDPAGVAILPQPFVTAALMQNEALKSAFSLTDAWDEVSEGSRMVTGVTIARTAFLEENPESVAKFLEDHAASVELASTDAEGTAAKIAEYEIVAKAPIAQKALPACNLVCITGEEMKEALSGYLQVLYDQDPASVGGEMPGDDFYYIP